MLSRHNLHEYQERCIQFIHNTPKCALWLEMGLGKSTTTLTAVSDLLDGLTVSRVLVVAPLRVAKSVWVQEAKKWQHLQHLTFSVCVGSERQRIAALHSTADVYVINRENVKWLVDFYKRKWPFDCVVLDESSSFKNASSQRFKALKKVSDLIERMIQLTGTPTSNGLLDVWAQIALLDNGSRLGRSMTVYKQRFFESDYMGYKFTPIKGAQQLIEGLISDVVVSMRAEDYLSLPERIDLQIPVELDTKTTQLYKELEQEFLLKIEDEEITAMTAATLAGKLLQVSNGAIYTNEHGNFIELHNEKLDALEELVEVNSEPLLVAYNFKSDLVRLKERFPFAVALDKDESTIEKWNNGEIQMLLAHPASASMGLNLQRGGSVIVWFGLNWSLELYQQFNARLHRQGQEKPVRIIHLVASSCIDEKVLQAIGNKAKTQDDLLNALRT
jgi:SNF2 family DNA or RNA helicase